MTTMNLSHVSVNQISESVSLIKAIIHHIKLDVTETNRSPFVGRALIGRGGTGSCPIEAASGRSSAAPGAGSGWSEAICKITLISVFIFNDGRGLIFCTFINMSLYFMNELFEFYF